MMALMGVMLAEHRHNLAHRRQREKERELLFIGNQFRQAIERYYERSPGELKKYPASLEELLKDNRFVTTQRHLRRIYRDPMTGNTEWGMVNAPEGGIMGCTACRKIPRENRQLQSLGPSSGGKERIL